MNIDKVVSFVRDVQHAKEQTRKWHEALENMTKAYVKANGTNDEIGITIGELCTFEVRSLGSSGNGLKTLVEMAVFLGSIWFLVGGGYAHLLYVMAGWMA